MKPIAVQPGENAPDVDDLMEKAKSMEELLEKQSAFMDNSQMKNITGVEEAPMTHYWTNQNQPSEDIESVSNRGGSVESVTFIDANPHQTGSALAAHENSAGGDADPSGESTARYGAGSSGVIKAPPMPPMGGPMGPPPGGDMGGGGAPPGGDDDGLAALLGGLGGGEGGDDLPDDPLELAKKIEMMGKKIQDILGGGGGPPGGGPPDMGGDEDMGGGGAPPPAPGA